MREKLFKVFNKIYGVLMSIAFWGGVLPLVPYLVMICIGGPAAEKVSVFLYSQYYKWICVSASVAVVFGLIGMYIGRIEAFSTKSLGKKTEEKAEEKPEEK